MSARRYSSQALPVRYRPTRLGPFGGTSSPDVRGPEGTIPRVRWTRDLHQTPQRKPAPPESQPDSTHLRPPVRGTGRSAPGPPPNLSGSLMWRTSTTSRMKTETSTAEASQPLQNASPTEFIADPPCEIPADPTRAPWGPSSPDVRGPLVTIARCVCLCDPANLANGLFLSDARLCRRAQADRMAVFLLSRSLWGQPAGWDLPLARHERAILARSRLDPEVNPQYGTVDSCRG